ncbi:MAG: flavodoxin domain-containing protein [Candidatus Bathyarchaeota archaeon]|nr:flavodoxin domain-containing protein [Candidatus Bathyarchaeota archaeon]
MKKVLVLYYSRSGNTEKMAKAVAEGAQSVGGVQVDLNFHVEVSELAGYDAVIVGAPTYRHELPVDFKNLFEGAEVKRLNLKGKIGGVFGSYGWSGEAPKQLTDIMAKLGMQTPQPPVLAKYAPDSAALDACRSLGKKISETLMNTP